MAFVDPDSSSGFVDPDQASNKETPKPSVFNTASDTIKSILTQGPIPRVMKKAAEIEDKIPYEVGGLVTDVHSRLPITRAIAPELGLGANVATQFMMGGGLMPGAAAEQIPLKSLVRMDTLKAAQQLGLDVPPSMKGSGVIERGLESIGGKADVARVMSSRNREAIQVAARREAGIPADQPITEDTLAAARQQIAIPYREISNISPRAKSAFEGMQSAREEAKGYWREFNGPNHPMSAKKEAMRLDAKADAYEKVIDLEAQKIGNPGLVDAMQMARVRLAKNYQIERALNVGTGEIDARQIGRTVDKLGTKAITGDLQTIGKFAQAYPDFVQPKAAATDVSMLRPYLALGAAGGGYAGSQHYTGSPYGAALGILPFLSPAARGIALSKLMQSGALDAGASAGRVAGAGMIPLSELNQ